MTDDPARPGTRPPSYDPRSMVTPYAFEVDEALLGTELATPKRRLAALLIDLLLASLLAALGGVLVGFAVAYIFFRVATRRQVQHPLKRWARGSLALLGALVLYITVVAILGGGWSVPFADDDEAPDTTAVAATSNPNPDAIRDSVVQGLRRELQESSGGDLNMDDVQLSGIPRPLLNLLVAAMDAPAEQPPDERTQTAALLREYSDALTQQDSSRMDSLRPQVIAAAAGPELRRIRQSLNRADERADDLEEENEMLRGRVEDPSVWRLIRSIANDFGLRIGWVGVYFTLFLTWWDGRTPGKRLFGMRVVRLDGSPLTLWLSFERFGGYAAGIATGLLGFAQVFWDPNRQAIQDRIAHTVVIRTHDPAAS